MHFPQRMDLVCGTHRLEMKFTLYSFSPLFYHMIGIFCLKKTNGHTHRDLQRIELLLLLTTFSCGRRQGVTRSALLSRYHRRVGIKQVNPMYVHCCISPVHAPSLSSTPACMSWACLSFTAITRTRRCKQDRAYERTAIRRGKLIAYVCLRSDSRRSCAANYFEEN